MKESNDKEEHMQNQRSAYAKSAIASSCIPLLCGDERTVYRTARHLYRCYGIRSYALIPKSADRTTWLSRFFSKIYVRRLPCAFDAPTLLSELAVRFLSSLGANAVPVFVDCTSGGTFDTEAHRDTLTAHCFFVRANSIDTEAPFSYCTESEEGGSSE